MAIISAEERARLLEISSRSSHWIAEFSKDDAPVVAQLRIRLPADAPKVIGIDPAKPMSEKTVMALYNGDVEPLMIYDPVIDGRRPATQADIDGMQQLICSLKYEKYALQTQADVLAREILSAASPAPIAALVSDPVDVSFTTQSEIDRIWDAVKAAAGR